MSWNQRHDRRSRQLKQGDPRDLGNLPPHLLSLSFDLVKFLRYEAHEKGMAEQSGWVPLEDIKQYTLHWSDSDFLLVVAESFTKNRPRFEKQLINGVVHLRAYKFEEYQNRRGGRGQKCSTSDDWETSSSLSCIRSGSMFEQRYKDDNHERIFPPPIRGGEQPWLLASSSGEENSSGQGTCQGAQTATVENHVRDTAGGNRNHDHSKTVSTSIFDGAWEAIGYGQEHCCKIENGWLTWKHGHRTAVTIEGNEIRLQQDTGDVLGKMSERGEIIWDDGDTFVRPDSDTRSASTASGSSVSPASSTVAEPPHVEPWQEHMAEPREERARGNWDGSKFGPDYLSIMKGELLHVQHDTKGACDGWAFGFSVQRQKYGWFPPSFSEFAGYIEV